MFSYLMCGQERTFDKRSCNTSGVIVLCGRKREENMTN